MIILNIKIIIFYYNKILQINSIIFIFYLLNFLKRDFFSEENSTLIFRLL